MDSFGDILTYDPVRLRELVSYLSQIAADAEEHYRDHKTVLLLAEIKAGLLNLLPQDAETEAEVEHLRLLVDNLRVFVSGLPADAAPVDPAAARMLNDAARYILVNYLAYEPAFVLDRRAVEIDPGHIDAHVACGRFLSAMGKYGEADEHFRSAFELDTQDVEIQRDIILNYKHWSNALASGNPGMEKMVKTMIFMADQLVDSGHGDCELMVCLGYANRRLGYYGQAEDYLSSAIEKDENSSDAHHELGIACFEKGSALDGKEDFLERSALLDRAIASLWKAHDTSGSPSSIILYDLGRCYDEVTDSQEAHRLYTDAIAADEMCYAAYLGKAACDMEFGNYESALTDVLKGYDVLCHVGQTMDGEAFRDRQADYKYRMAHFCDKDIFENLMDAEDDNYNACLLRARCLYIVGSEEEASETMMRGYEVLRGERPVEYNRDLSEYVHQIKRSQYLYEAQLPRLPHEDLSFGKN